MCKTVYIYTQICEGCYFLTSYLFSKECLFFVLKFTKKSFPFSNVSLNIQNTSAFESCLENPLKGAFFLWIYMISKYCFLCKLVCQFRNHQGHNIQNVDSNHHKQKRKCILQTCTKDRERHYLRFASQTKHWDFEKEHQEQTRTIHISEGSSWINCKKHWNLGVSLKNDGFSPRNMGPPQTEHYSNESG